MGWNDPFALAVNVQRQQAYRNHFGLTYVYTPQLVVHGRVDLPGTSLEEAREAIQRVQKTPAVPLSIIRRSDGSGLVEAGPSLGEGTVWRVVFDRHQQTLVKGGGERGASSGQLQYCPLLGANGTMKRTGRRLHHCLSRHAHGRSAGDRRFHPVRANQRHSGRGVPSAAGIAGIVAIPGARRNDASMAPLALLSALQGAGR